MYYIGRDIRPFRKCLNKQNCVFCKWGEKEESTHIVISEFATSIQSWTGLGFNCNHPKADYVQDEED